MNIENVKVWQYVDICHFRSNLQPFKTSYNVGLIRIAYQRFVRRYDKIDLSHIDRNVVPEDLVDTIREAKGEILPGIGGILEQEPVNWEQLRKSERRMEQLGEKWDKCQEYVGYLTFCISHKEYRGEEPL